LWSDKFRDCTKSTSISTFCTGIRSNLCGCFCKNTSNDVSSNWSFFRDKVALTAAIAYSIIGFQNIIYDETFPIWTIAHVKDGGLDFSPSDLGLVSAFSGISLFLVQVFTVLIIKRIGYLQSFRVAVLFSVVFFSLVPTLNWIVRLTPNWAFWIIILGTAFLRTFLSNISFSPIIQMVQNSVLPENAGTLNGFAQSLVAFCRATGPFIGGNILAWSLQNSLEFPFNFFFTFLLLGLIGVLMLGIITLMPPSLDKPKKELV